jgi:hypothetical protein
MFNKKGQIAETMTWVIATITIVVILTLSIFIVQFGFKEKSFVFLKENNLLATKSFTGYLLTENNGKKVFDLINDNEKINDFEGNLAASVFRLSSKEYLVWIGVMKGKELVFDFKDYGFLRIHSLAYGLEEIKLNNDKYIRLLIHLNEK